MVCPLSCLVNCEHETCLLKANITTLSGENIAFQFSYNSKNCITQYLRPCRVMSSCGSLNGPSPTWLTNLIWNTYLVKGTSFSTVTLVSLTICLTRMLLSLKFLTSYKYPTVSPSLCSHSTGSQVKLTSWGFSMVLVTWRRAISGTEEKQADETLGPRPIIDIT